MKVYTKSQLQNLTGDELFEVLGDIQRAFEEIHRAGLEIDAACAEERRIEQEIMARAKRMRSKGTKIVMALTLAVCIPLLLFEDFIFAILLAVCVYFISGYIDKKRHMSERLQALREQYAPQIHTAEGCKSRAQGQIEAIRRRGVYSVAAIVLPGEFIENYPELTRLINTMRKYMVWNLPEGLKRYYDDKHREAVLEEERLYHQRMEEINRARLQAEQDAAKAQQEQAYTAKQQARDTRDANRELIREGRRAADAAEEQARIAKDLYWRTR